METPQDPIFEEREELMISPTGDGDPNLRTAHFINPSSTSRNGAVSELPPLPHSSRFGFSDHKVALDVSFKGRRNPPTKWKEWVYSLRSRYEPTWKKLGIFDAVMNSTYNIYRDNDLVLGAAEKWCPETNTFIFPWGEATITLEDMMVLGGYPVLGDPHFSSIESDEIRMVLDDLIEVYRKLAKVGSYQHITICAWIEYFIGTGHELEHEAFLSVWFTIFVYPYHSSGLMGRKMFPFAIRLARGIPIALAPLVLASIYKDLSLLKQEMEKSVNDSGKCSSSMLQLWAPFQLVQLWVWERFPTLRPKPNSIELGEPRAARWHKVSKLKAAGNVRVALDSAGDCFQWRPYASGVSNWQHPKLYKEQEEWVSVSPELDMELESFARCIRVSEISEPGGIQQYLPHRVAMQFGLDQDIPGCVPQSSKAMDLHVAWSNYSRPIGDNRLYIPPRLFESDVTKKYFDWWKQSALKVESMVIVKKPISKPRVGSFLKECQSLILPELMSMNKEGNGAEPFFEEREELMISPTGDGYPNLRTAHFINPSSTSRNAAVSELPHSSRFGFSDHKVVIDVSFKGRRNPPKKWKEWVYSLRSRYEPTWKKVGIFDAIMNSTYSIHRDNDLVLGIAEKWCPETNTFIFPWGEATITLEDMMVLGGYPVLGDPHFSSIESDEMRMVLEDLNEAYRRLAKVGSCPRITICAWIEHFIGTGHELEHEAFLSTWLTRFVYPYNSYVAMGRKMFPFAIRLAGGIPIALAPLVLASIYMDLSLLKQEMVKSVNYRGECSSSMLELWAPFQLVQLWVWERFPTLRPKPNSIELGEPRAARWHEVPKLKAAGDVRLALDSAGDCFQWRPYASGVSNWQHPKLYREQEEWVSVGPELDTELESFTRCIRVSEISEPGGIQQYLPHRVAMQFGLDQDIPGCVPRFSKAMDLDVAWSNYSRPIGDSKLYIPPRLFESDVTKKYFDWWKQSVLKVKSMVIVKKPRSKRRVRGFVKECESLLLQELGSMNKKGDVGEPFPCSESKSYSSSTTGRERLMYKSVKEIAQSEASVQSMKGSTCGDNTTSPGSHNGEDTICVTMKKPKLGEDNIDVTMKKAELEEKDEMSEIDKAIAVLEVEFANRLDNPLEVLSTDEVEQLIAGHKQEFGMSSSFTEDEDEL